MEINQREKGQAEKPEIKKLPIKKSQAERLRIKRLQTEKLRAEVENLKLEQKKLSEQFLTAVKHLAAVQQDNVRLSGKLEQQEEYIRKILQILNASEKEFEERLELSDYKSRIRRENLFYEWNAEKLPEEFFYPAIRSREETIEDIVKNRKSLARFGDGEFSIMFGRERAAFQKGETELRKRLLDVISRKDSDLLIGIADNYGSLKGFTDKAADDIRAYMTEEVRREHLSVLDAGRVYENAYITRPYALYRDNQTVNPGKRFAALQTIWNNRAIVFVEGEKTRMGVGNDLFANADSIQRVICPAENAFAHYKEVFEFLLTLSKDKLYLLALGPTATVLAADLEEKGYQAIDIGHLDLEYEWYRKGTGGPAKVSHKYNNEYPGGRSVEDISDEQYEREILQRFL